MDLVICYDLVFNCRICSSTMGITHRDGDLLMDLMGDLYVLNDRPSRWHFFTKGISLTVESLNQHQALCFSSIFFKQF